MNGVRSRGSVTVQRCGRLLCALVLLLVPVALGVSEPTARAVARVGISQVAPSKARSALVTRAGWSAPIRLAAGKTDAPQATVDAHGNTFVVWRANHAFLGRSVSSAGVRGSTKVVWPSSTGAVGGEFGNLLFGSSTGHALMAWSTDSGRLFVRTRAPSGQLGRLTNLSAPAGGTNLGLIDAAVAPNGTSTLLLSAEMHTTPPRASEPYYFEALYAEQVSPEGSVGAPLLVDQGTQTFGVSPINPQQRLLAVGPSGVVHITWVRGPQSGEGCCNRLWTRSIMTDGRLGPASPISPTGTDVSEVSVGEGAQVVLGRGGRLVFVWRHLFDQHGNHFQEDIEARSESPSGVPGKVETLSPRFTTNDRRETQGGQPSGVQLGSLTALPSGKGALVAYTTASQRCAARCTAPTRYELVERQVSGAQAGSAHTLVRSTSADNDGGLSQALPIAWTGAFVGSGSAALAIWQTRVGRDDTLGIGTGAASISSNGRPVALPSAFAAGTLTSSYSATAAAVGETGKEVVIGSTGRHGLELVSRHA
jgi:hypothetical protein